MYIVKQAFCGIEVGTKLDDSAVSKEFRKELIENGTLEFIEAEPTQQTTEPSPVETDGVPTEETPALEPTAEPTQQTTEPSPVEKKGAKSKK